VGVTFEKKYGVCRDKAGLLVEMLRLAGFKAYPVLINVGARRDPQVPQPAFNHAIVGVELTPGQYTLMDPTDENTRDLLPYYDSNRSYLVCKPGGEGLRVSGVPSPGDHMVVIKTSGTLDASGRLSATSDISFGGVNDDAYRNGLARRRPDQRKQLFEKILKQAVPGLKLTSFTLTPENVLDTSMPLSAQLKFTARGLTANGNDKSVVSLPWIGGDMGMSHYILEGAVGLATRKYPLDADVPCGVREEMSLKLSGFGAPLSVPQCPSVNVPGVLCDEHVALANSTLKCSREFVLKQAEFTPQQYLDLKRALKDNDLDGRKGFILALPSKPVTASTPTVAATPETSDSADARILDSEKSLLVKDAHTATYRVKYSKLILTYQGKTQESEIKIPYDPACQTARLLEGVSISPKGQRQEISKTELNVMDQDWDASARRYTAGKTLVASLPGVEIGSTIQVEYEITTHDKPYVSSFEYFQFPQPVDQKHFTLTAPADLPVHALITGPQGMVTGNETVENGTRTMEWQASHVAALPSEPQLPPGWSYSAGVQFYVGHAQDYWKALHGAMQMRAGHATRASGLAHRLTAACKTPQDKARVIRDYVAQNIREAGPTFTDLPLSELSDADTTLSDGYGHAADRAILLYAMLQAAGLQPDFVMASSLPPVKGIDGTARSFPLPDEFNKPLVRIKVGNDFDYLNDGDQYARLGTTAYNDKLGLDLNDRSYFTIHAAPGCADKKATDLAMRIAPDGSARITVSRYYYGQVYNRMHKYFAELPPQERQHYFQEAVSSVVQGAKAVGGLTTRFDTYPGLEQFTVAVDHYGVASGNYLYFNLPETPSPFGVSADERSLPLYMTEQSEQVTRTTVHLPAGWRLTDIAPRNESFSAPGGSQVRVVDRTTGNRCTVTESIAAVPAVVGPDDYPRLLTIQTAVGGRSETTFLLQRR
ncbi:MAG: DUF3857 domain-containing protein, partial [Candidatus Xenobia bacterium]